MFNKGILHIIFLGSQLPLALTWFGRKPVTGFNGVQTLADTPGQYLYFFGFLLYVILLCSTDYLKLASICYPFMLTGVLVAFPTWPVLTILGEINLAFSFSMMSWGYIVDVVVLILAWIGHLSYVYYHERKQRKAAMM